MKRITLLLIPILMLTILVLAVGAEIPPEAGPPRRVQMRLEQYRSSSLVNADTRAFSITPAKRPWNLTMELGWPAVGDSVYSQTDQPLTWSRSDGKSPLPFPPKEVWCALMEGKGETAGKPSYSVVLVALHMDMYSGDRIFHQAPNEPLSIVGEVLSALGCELELD
jgi:hypothetical protein